MSLKSTLLSKLVLAAALGSSALALASTAEAAPKSQSGKNAAFVVVDGDRGRVVYDDGHDDVFCVFRRVIVWNRYLGDYVIRKRMVCR